MDRLKELVHCETCAEPAFEGTELSHSYGRAYFVCDRCGTENYVKDDDDELDDDD